MSTSEITFGAFGPLHDNFELPTARVNLQLIKVTESEIGNGKRTTTLTLWDGVREIGI